MGIYKITYPNGKIYIGQSTNIRKRLMEHNQRAHNATNSARTIQKCEQALIEQNYFIEEVEIEIVSSVKELDFKEEYWITYYDTLNPDKGYNQILNHNISGLKGVNHPNALFCKEDINNIIDLLLNHRELSIKDIAEQYNVNQATILRISLGQSYVNPSLDYPLRRQDHSSQQKNKYLDYFSNEEELINLKNDLKYRWDLKIEPDLKNKYNIPLKIIRAINNGNKFEEIGDFQYPIRPKNLRNNCNFTIEDIKNILYLLRETKKSFTEIGNEYGVHRDTISKINLGYNYIIKDYNYPARIN